MGEVRGAVWVGLGAVVVGLLSAAAGDATDSTGAAEGVASTWGEGIVLLASGDVCSPREPSLHAAEAAHRRRKPSEVVQR